MTEHRKPVIGISTSPVQHRPGAFADQLGHSYIEAVRRAGGIPVLLPNDRETGVLEVLDGLLLSGGGDFDPCSFGQEDRGTAMGGVSADRDATELALLKYAPEDLPILGICRGVQALAVGFGGTLIQDLPSARPSAIMHSQSEGRSVTTHGVEVSADSQLGQIVGAQELKVNTFHHQAVDQIPEGFRAVAWATDGLVEAIERADRPFCLGVQWHPENLVEGEEHARRLFSAFVGASAQYRRSRHG